MIFAILHSGSLQFRTCACKIHACNQPLLRRQPASPVEAVALLFTIDGRLSSHESIIPSMAAWGRLGRVSWMFHVEVAVSCGHICSGQTLGIIQYWKRQSKKTVCW